MVSIPRESCGRASNCADRPYVVLQPSRYVHLLTPHALHKDHRRAAGAAQAGEKRSADAAPDDTQHVAKRARTAGDAVDEHASNPAAIPTTAAPSTPNSQHVSDTHPGRHEPPPNPQERPQEPLRRPSLGLRQKCPLCFGGNRPDLARTKYVALSIVLILEP